MTSAFARFAGFTIILTTPFLSGAVCAHVFTIPEVTKNASQLQGKVVCLRGMFVKTLTPEWNSTIVSEMVPLPIKRRESNSMKVGLVEWSPETGIREEYYKPDSFAILPQTSPASQPPRPLDVIIRAAVAYKKDLFASLPPNVPEEIRRARYDVELIVLEIIKARTLR
jgi:hypothetical protein